jgi:hypothetical protein
MAPDVNGKFNLRKILQVIMAWRCLILALKAVMFLTDNFPEEHVLLELTEVVKEHLTAVL